MGLFYENIGVGSPAGGDLAPVSALVDTGASYTILPSGLLTELGIVAQRPIRFRLADGRQVEYAIGEARIAIRQRELPCRVVFGPEGSYLLGADTLANFRLLVNPRRERLEPEH